MARAPIERLIDAADLRCTLCNAPMSVSCDCWEKCSCGWSAERGTCCRNPATTRCSSKVKYGVYDRRTKGWAAKPATPTKESEA